METVHLIEDGSDDFEAHEVKRRAVGFGAWQEDAKVVFVDVGWILAHATEPETYRRR